MKTKKKKISLFRPLILSRHPSHNVLRSSTRNLPLLPIQSVVRFGSTTEKDDTISNGGKRIEINTVEAIKNSANKLKMKQKFNEAGVRTAQWITSEEFNKIGTEEFDFPIVAKAHFGSKGKGNTLIKNKEELTNWSIGKTLTNYIFEKFYNYSLEYRLHVTSDGCFYTCRKALKKDVPEEDKWRRHDDICVWFLEDNPEFKKPNTWNEIVNDCINALNAVNADILSFDVKVQGELDKEGNRRKYQDYILLECNSASSMDNGTGEISQCAKAYIDILPKIILKKWKN